MKSNRKPDKELRIEYHTDYSGDNVFASKARLLQSVWRDEKGYDFERYGNYLKLDFAKENGTNFLTKGITEIVKYELVNKSIDRKVIQEPRIWNNLLSSQPMAFNLFGELKLKKEIATKIFKALYPERKIEEVTQIEFEYSPSRKSEKYTNDSSAFDVFVVYKNDEKKKGFFGIEVKYSENLNDKPSTHKLRYEEVAIKSGIFEMSKLGELKSKPIQQIWRDHLLALSMSKINKEYDFGDFIYLYPKDNTNCQNGVNKYQTAFKENTASHFIPLTLEKFIEELKKVCDENWVSDFEDRYLNFEKINKKNKAKG
jgi:hypothetical protein